MSLRYVVSVLVLAGLMPAGAMALGLGDIHLRSALNAPLDADIDVTATAEELAGLKVTLASRDSFARYGLDYPAFLSAVTLVPAKGADGRDVIRVRSRDVVTEPFATLLVEASWARGRLVREYTVLLDPPVFTGESASPAAAVVVPEAPAQTRSGAVERPAMVPAAPPVAQSESTAQPSLPPPPPPRPLPAAPRATAEDRTYIVQRGDTLSSIAARNYPNSHRERALLALFTANPSAFDGNMNVLRSGASLKLPETATVAAVGPAEARSEVSSQYRSWVATRGGGQLRLVPPSDGGTGPAKGAATGGEPETAGLQQRLDALQAQLTESRRLLELKNAELARLQSQLGQSKGATQETAPAPAESPQPTSEPPAPAAAPEPTPAAAAQAPSSAPAGGSLLDWLLANWYVALGGLAVVLAALFGWRQMRVRQAQDFDRTLDRLSNSSYEAAQSSRAAETQPMRALQSQQDSSFVVEESGTHQTPRISDGEFASLQSASVPVDQHVSGDTSITLDQGDPLAEADFHMAYGLYDQAADLVRIAIAREPQRRDLKLKLLEVFFVWGNKDQFLQLARELSTSRDKAMAGEWEKIVIMGRQIAPEDALFASAGGSLPGVASGGVDLNLEGGQNRVDFDLLGEPSISAGRAGNAVDLDLGAAFNDDDATGELKEIGDTGVDFVLDDPARGEATGSTREMPQSQTVTLEHDSNAEAPTVESRRPADMDSPTIRQKLDAGVRHNLAGVDQTAELALDDLGLELSGADTGEHGAADASAGTAPTMLTALDDDTRELFAKAQGVAHDTAEMPAAGASASGTWLFTDKDFSSGLPAAGEGADSPTELVTVVMPSVESSLTDQLEALKDQGDVDLNLDNLEATGENSGLLDLDVGVSAASEQESFGATQLLPDQAPTSEPEPATMSEVGTKLDLARAYMDMGDPEGARSILEEVLAEGSASQKTEARRLIDSLPG